MRRATTSRRSSTAANVAGISSQPSGAPANAVWSTYIAVDDADDAADGVRAAGGSVLSAPFDVFDAGRMAVCADPQGARFSLWQAGRHTGAQVVNAPGSWNWSDLHTRDVVAAPHWAVTFGVDGTDAIADRATDLSRRSSPRRTRPNPPGSPPCATRRGRRSRSAPTRRADESRSPPPAGAR